MGTFAEQPSSQQTSAAIMLLAQREKCRVGFPNAIHRVWSPGLGAGPQESRRLRRHLIPAARVRLRFVGCGWHSVADLASPRPVAAESGVLGAYRWLAPSRRRTIGKLSLAAATLNRIGTTYIPEAPHEI